MSGVVQRPTAGGPSGGPAHTPSLPPRPKRIAITQSNYLPWKGYFDTINSVDEFILYDDVQYTKRDWRNRNRIKTPAGVAMAVRASQGQGPLRSGDRHDEDQRPGLGAAPLGELQHAYARAEHFDDVAETLQDYFVARRTDC